MYRIFRSCVLLSLCLTCVNILATYAAGETLSFRARLDTVVCATACGICCSGEGLLSEMNGGFTALVGDTGLDLSRYRDDTAFHRFTGHFFSGTGQCGEGNCALFAVESVDDATTTTANFDSSSLRLSIPYVTVDGATVYSVVLEPPFNLVEATLVSEVIPVPQFGDCSGSENRCAAGTSCISFFGIAGGIIQFRECHIPCAGNEDCPSDQSCQVIADGPGQVCWMN